MTSFEHALESQGLSTVAVQLDIYRGKYKAAEQDIQRLKHELQESSERLSQQASKLNEQKLQYSNLTHRYSNAVSRLSAVESQEKELEETLMQEQRSHQTTKDSLERARAQLSQKEQLFQQELKHAESRFNELNDQYKLETSEKARQTEKEAQRREIQNIKDKFRVQHEGTLLGWHEMVERLDELREEDESAVFVARSAAQSSVTEVEAKLSRVQNQLAAIVTAFDNFVEVTDDDMNKLMLHLMKENKNLYTELSSVHLELEQALSKQDHEQRRYDQTMSKLKDDSDYVRNQNTALQDTVKKCQESIEVQRKKSQEHEAKMQQIIEDLRLTETTLSNTVKERDSLKEQYIEASQRAQDAVRGIEQAESEIDDVLRMNKSLKSDVAELQEKSKDLAERLKAEHRNALAAIKVERDDAVAGYERARTELTETVERMRNLQNELAVKDQQFISFSQQLEETHHSYSKTLQDELLGHRSLYEREIAELRQDQTEKTGEISRLKVQLDEVQGQCEAYRNQVHFLDEQHQHDLSELKAAAASHAKLDERIRALSLELNAKRLEADTAANSSSQLEIELATLKHACQKSEAQISSEKLRHEQTTQQFEAKVSELEHQLRQSVEDYRSLKQKHDGAGNNGLVKSMREKFERDRQQLMEENDRIQKQFAEAQRANENLHRTNTQMAQRVHDQHSMQSQLDELLKRCNEIPYLQGRIEELEDDNKRLSDNLSRVRGERDETAAKVDFFLEESRHAAEKNMDLDRLFRETFLQVRRLDQQIDEANSLASQAQFNLAPSQVNSQNTSHADEAFVGAQRSPHSRQKEDASSNDESVKNLYPWRYR